MADLTIKGAIKLINEVKVISDKFSVREFILTTGDKYSQDIIFQTTNDKMDIIAPFKRGDAVEVSFNMRGREYGGKYYNTLDAWKVIAIDGDGPKQDDDDLPF